MDCLEFRRLLGSEPHVVRRAAREHLRNCVHCADATARAQAFEARLAESMAIPVPDGLADRILLAQLTGTRQQRRSGVRRGAWVALAAAASFALAIGVVRYQHASDPLADLVLAHIDGAEKAALQLRTPIAAAAVEHAFADRGVHLAWVPPDISYVHECPIGKYRAVHMVMPEQGSPVSVLYVADHPKGRSIEFRRDGMHGREVPIAKGTLVLVARSDARFDAIEHSWHDAIEGPAQVAAGSL